MYGERIQQLRTAKGYTQDSLGDRLNVSPKTIGTWERESRKPPIDKISEMATLFGVSTDYLLGKTDKPHYYSLSNKEKLDIGDQAQRIIDGLDSNTDVNFFGEPMTEEQKQSMRDIIATGLLINKEKAKKKFTPKKYRDTGTDGD